MGILNIKAPTGGISRQTGFQSQPPFTTFRSVNMWPKDVISGRQVSASRPPLVEFPSPGDNVNMLALVNGDATQDPQFSAIAATNGTVKYWNGSSWTAIASSVSVTTGRPVAAHAFLKRVIIMNDTTPLVFNYDDNTLVNFVATDGTVPSDCRIIAPAFGTFFIAGALEQPHVFSCPRTGDIFDWDFAVANTDLGGAYTSSGEDEGFILEPITALVPLDSDALLIACVDEMWVLRGHPRRGGVLEKLPDHLGILGFTAWTKGPDGEVYFMSRLGVGVLDAAGTRPTLLSKKVIPADLVGLPYDYTEPTVCLQYNPLWNGVHVTVRGEAEQAWWMDLNDKISFHEDKYEEYPNVTTWFGSLETEAASGVLFAGDSGIRRFDSLGSEDMACELLTGPFRLSESDLVTSKTMQIDFRFLHGTTDSDTTTVTVLTGANGDDVVQRYENELLNYRESTTMDKLLRNGGRMRPQLAGSAELFVMQSFNGDRIVFEGAEVLLEPHGKNVFIPRQTEFEEPSTDVTIGNGWLVGGVYAEAIGATPDSALDDVTLFIDLADMPSGWWDAVAADGSDIRVTNDNNALRPVHLIEFDKEANTGLLATKEASIGIGPVLRVWCKNPLARTAPAGGPYGQYNCYPSDCMGFWPAGGGQDATRNRRHLTGRGGLLIGGASGPLGEATDYTFSDVQRVSFPYTFSTTTADADPGDGFIRLNNATQLSATVLRIDLLDADNNTRTTEIDALAVGSKVFIRHLTDASKWIRGTVSAEATPSGYRNITIGSVTGSGANPFANNDDVVVSWDTNTNFSQNQARSYALMDETTLSDHTLISYDNPVTAWMNDDGTDLMQGFGLADADGVITEAVWWNIDLINTDVNVQVGGNTYELSADLTAANTLHQVASTVASGTRTLYVDGTSRDSEAAVADVDVAEILMVGGAFYLADVGVGVSDDVQNPGTIRSSLVQLYNTAKTAAFVDYQYDMVTDNTTFWGGGWTLG